MLQSIVSSGLAVGAVYALIGITYNVMFSASRVFSFTAGMLGMLGGVLGALFINNLGMNAVLAFVLNILPVPGLDGFGVIEPYLGMSARRVAARVRPWAPIALFVLIFGVPGVSSALFGLGSWLFGAVGGDPGLAGFGYSELFFWRR